MALKYGFVVAQFAEVVGDRGSEGDEDRYPDQLGTSGTVTFTPQAESITDVDPVTGQTIYITPRAVQANLDVNGQMVDKDLLRGVWLVAGLIYTVKASFRAATWQIQPTEAHTLQAPLDVVAQMPITPSPSVKFVLSEQTLIDARAAAARAEAAAQAAEDASGGPRVTSVNNRSGVVTLSSTDVGLGAVDNTSDVDKPVSMAQGAAIGARALASRKVSAGTGLTGGGDFTADRALALSAASIASLAKADSAFQKTANSIKYADLEVALQAAYDRTLTAVQPAALTSKADLVGGVIPSSQIPAIALGTSVQVASRAAMLALTSAQVQPGDLAIDTSAQGASSTRGTYQLVGADPSQIANWNLLNANSDAVQSVNGQTGTVTLAASDVAAVPNTAAANGQAFVKTGAGTLAGVTYNAAATANQIALRNSTGDVTVNTTPTAATDAASKGYVDGFVPGSAATNSQVYSKNSGGVVTGINYTTAATGGAIPVRDSNGQLVSPTPTAAAHLANKQYVDDRAGDQAPVTANATATGTIDLTAAAAGPTAYRFSLTGPVVFTIPTPTINTRSWTVTLRLSQDGTGGRTIGLPSYIKWAGGVKPTFSTAAAAVDIVNLYWDGVNWYGFLAGAAFA